jgi:hypothetical protein
MFSTDVAVREEQLFQELLKQLLLMTEGAQESKKLAGKLVRLEQFDQALLNLRTLEQASNGKLVSLLQLFQEKRKSVAELVSIAGKLVSS